jgi:hypothetical protein
MERGLRIFIQSTQGMVFDSKMKSKHCIPYVTPLFLMFVEDSDLRYVEHQTIVS